MVQATSAQAHGKRPDFTHIIQRITHTLSILARPAQVVELRIPGLNGKRTDSGYFTDFDKLARAAATYSGRAEGIYVTLNPLNPALLARSSNRMTEYAKNTTGDRDITCRRWLFVDFDPVRPAGISSSEAEHAAAIAHAVECRTWLYTRNIPSVLADSGNGAHLLIPIDLPNTGENTALLKAVLSVLSAKFSDQQVEIDTSTTNASRIIKLYGTFACKGDNVPERPHRQAMILALPDALDPIEPAALQSLAALVDPQADQPRSLAPKRSPSTTKINSGTTDHQIIDEIKAHFDMVAYAESKLGVSATPQGNEYRLPGNQGFLIRPDKGCWYHHGSHYGGDALDLVGYLLYGNNWSRQDKTLFKSVLREAADFSGISLPMSHNKVAATPHAAESKSTVSEPTTDAPPNDPARKVDLMDVARAWKQRYAEELAWDTKVIAWRRWSGTHWHIEKEYETLDLLSVDIMRSLGVPVSNTNKIDSVLRLARALCKRQFSPSRRLINFQNGTLDLDTMTGHAHTPNDHLTQCLPYDYLPTGRYSLLENFLKSVIPDTEGQRAYMTHIGLALIGDRSLHKALVLLGPPRSGKTTLLKLAQLALGGAPGQFPTAILFSPESRGANSRATWIDQSPRLICLDEFPEEALRDEGEELFKSMTAHGGVSMWLKYRDERAENVWTPKLMFATNNRMRYRDSSGALTRRLLVVECPHSLPDLQLDGHLLEKLIPELGAFASACIQMALEVQQQRTYPESEAMRALLADIERNGDAVKLWISENCIFASDVFTPTQLLYQNFKWWCIESGLYPVSRPKLRDILSGYSSDTRCVKKRVVDAETGEVKLLWCMVGVRLRGPMDDLAE